MDLLTWLIVGLIAGVLASLVMGGTGYGIISDIIIGIVGAFVGGWIFDALAVNAPLKVWLRRYLLLLSERSFCCL